MACGCYNTETEEYVNQCGTEHCPLLNGEMKTRPLNGTPIKEFFTGVDEEDKD